MKKIALIKKDFGSGPIGGLEKVTEKIIEAFQERKRVVSLLTTGHTIQPNEVIRYSLQSKLKFNQIKEFDRWCFQMTRFSSRYDVVFSIDRSSFQTHHRAGNGVHAAYLDLRRKRETFLKSLSFYCNPLHRTFLDLEKKTFESFFLQKLIVNSYLVKNQILHYYSTPEEKIHVIHNGVEWEKMQQPFTQSLVQRNAMSASMGLDPLLFHFLFAGSNFERKGLTPLLQALAQLKGFEFHLSVVGEDKNFKKFQQQTRLLGLDKKVSFFGPQRSVEPFYQIADVLLMPSLYDPFSNVTVEALAMGLFVISSKDNGGHEILQKYSGIVLHDPYNLEEMKEALQRSFHYPKRTVQAEQIRNSVKHLNWDNQMEKLCHLCLS